MLITPKSMYHWIFGAIIIIFLSAKYSSCAAYESNYLHKQANGNKTFKTDSEVLLNFVAVNRWNNILFFTDEAAPFIVRLMSSTFVQCTITFCRGITNYTDSQLISSIRHQYMIVWGRRNCQMHVTTMASRLVMFDKWQSWLFFQSGNFIAEEFISFTQFEESLTPNSHIYFLTATKDTVSNDLYYQVVRLAHVRLGSSNKTQSLRYKGLNIQVDNVEGARNLPLQGYHLKIGMIHVPPVSVVDSTGGTPVCSGFVAVLIQLLSLYLGFSYELVIQSTNNLGSVINGSWNGLIGAVHRKDVDIGGLPLSLTLQRLAAVDFSPYILRVTCGAVIRRPINNNKEFKFWVYAVPFPLGIWIVCGATCVLIFLCAAFTLHPLSYSKNHIPHERRDFTFHALVWGFTAAALNTDTPEIPHRRSTQTIFLVFMKFMRLVSVMYICLLTATLTIKEEPYLYNDLDELIDDGKYEIAVLKGTSIAENLMSDSSRTMKRIWKKIKHNPHSLVSSNEKGFDLVKNGRYVYLTAEELIAGPRVAKSNCSLTILKQRYLQSSVHFLFPKYSPLLEVVSLKIHPLRSAGILQKISDLHFPKHDSSSCKEKPLVTIPIQQVIGAFLVFSIGIIFALFYFILEIKKENHRIFYGLRSRN